MKELKGNMFSIECDALCITTNGFVKSNGECVMGIGCAKNIKQYYPNIGFKLGKLIKTEGNKVHLIYQDDGLDIISFPVKPITKVCKSHDDYVSHMKFGIGQTIAGWACKADINIIEQSAYQLVELANKHDWGIVLLPRAGCGAGELDWSTVKPILSKILDDRFIAVTY